MQQTLELAASQRSLGFIVEALGLDWLIAHVKAQGVTVNDVLPTTDTVTERGLTNGSVRFRFTTGVQTMGAGAMVLGNTGTTLPENPHDAWTRSTGVLVAHVWSYQHQGTTYAINPVRDQLQALKGVSVSIPLDPVKK